MNAPAAQLTAAILAFTAAKASSVQLDADRLPVVPFAHKVPGLERFLGYAGQTTAEALERALGASLRAA